MHVHIYYWAQKSLIVTTFELPLLIVKERVKIKLDFDTNKFICVY